MGSYTDLSVGGYPILETKSAVLPEAMTVFRETDRRVFTRRVSERNALVWGVRNENNTEIETAIEYSCEVGHAIDRLNVMGFTLDCVQREFELGRQTTIAKFESWAEDDTDRDWFADEWDFVKDLTFDSYLNGFRTLIAERLRPYPLKDHEEADVDPVVTYILSDNEDYLFGFFAKDIRFLLRLACEIVPRDSRVIQDLTELVHAGYYAEDEPVCENVTRALVSGHPENAQRIVLTEGSTDAKILKEALALLYPHLAGYYTFLDFESSRSPGGAGQLVSVVKAFAGAGITNRIVAIFDNDTAAHEAIRALAAVSLPSNIAICHYPELDTLRSYPTHGPSGMASLDVNGLAGSLELYLGDDVLRDSQGLLIPVQWKGYSMALRQYQGEVLEKSSILARFDMKLARCKNDPAAFQEAEWLGLRGILETIFFAFV